MIVDILSHGIIENKYTYSPSKLKEKGTFALPYNEVKLFEKYSYKRRYKKRTTTGLDGSYCL